MVKATKRTRKFNAKTGGGDVSSKRKGTTKKGRGSSKQQHDSGNNDDGGKKKEKARQDEELKKKKEERDTEDFTNLGTLDIESFFEKAVDGLEEETESSTHGDKNNDDDDIDDEESGNYDDDEGSIDSYTSLLNGSQSSDEDIEASEKQLRDQLAKLGEDDPEFHKYLKENESSLLEFDASDNTDEDDDDDEYVQDEDNMSSILKSIDHGTDDDEDFEDTTTNNNNKKNIPSSKIFKRQQKQYQNKFLLTPTRLQQLEQGAFTSHSIKGLKRIVNAYRTACHLSDVNSQDGRGEDSSDENDGGGGGKKKKEFQITSPVVFDSLMVCCLVNCHEEFYYHLLREDESEEESGSNSSGSSDSDSDGSDSDDEKDGKQSTKKASSKETTTKKKEKATNIKTTIDNNNKPLHPKTLSKSPNWSSLQPIIESFVKSTLHVLSESGKQPKLLQFVLSSLQHYIPYLTGLKNPKISKSYLKTLVSLWSSVQDNSQEYNTVRLQAFLRIRQLAITQPYPYIEEVLKSTYLAYAQRTKFGTASSVSSILPTLTFMGNCIVELYTLDYASSYQFGFVYIRQLALLLRSGIMKQNGDGEEILRTKVCCWQYVHCLRLWVAVLCAACGTTSSSIKQHDGDVEGNNNNNSGASSKKLGGGPNNSNKDEESNMLHSLVYPLTEIILGVTRLGVANNVRFVPLRLHCVRLLQQLAACTETFIPTTSLLLGVLDLKEVGMKPLRDGGKKNKNKNKNKGGGGGSGTIRGLRLPLILKLPKENTLRTMEQMDSVLKETFVLLNREVDMYRYSPGFPEFSFVILQRLRKFNKEIKDGRWRAYSKGTMELCEKYSTFAITARATLPDAPKDVRRLEALKPTNVPTMRERYESAIAKEKRLEAATQPAMKASKKDNDDDKNKRKRKDMGANGSGDEEEEKEEGIASKKKTRPKKKKKAPVVNEDDLNNVNALEEEDEVQEGIWSDSESD